MNVQKFLIAFLLLVSFAFSVANGAEQNATKQTGKIVKHYEVYELNGASTGFDNMLGVLSGATKEKKFGDIDGKVYWQVYDSGGSKVECRVYSEVEMEANKLAFVGFGSIRGTPDIEHTKQFAGTKVDKRALDKKAKVEVVLDTGRPLELQSDRFTTYEEAPKDIWKKYGDKETFRFTMPDEPPYVLYTCMQKHPVHSGGGFDFGRFITFRNPNRKEKLFSLSEGASLAKDKTKVKMTDKEMVAMFSPYAQAHGESLTQFGKASDNTIRSVTVDTDDPEAPEDPKKKQASIDRGEYNYGLLFADNDSYSATAGDTHEAVFLLSNTGTVKWYVKSPSESGYGTLVETDSGTEEARFSYTFGSSASGSYVITGVVSPATGPGYEASYTVSVSTKSPTSPVPSVPSTSTLSYTLTSSDGSYTAEAGTGHEANFTTNQAYSSVYWYVRSPSGSGLGTGVDTDYGDSSTTKTAQLSYSFPTGVAGDYVITAYVYGSDNSVYQTSYTVSVSLPTTTPAAPAAPAAFTPTFTSDKNRLFIGHLWTGTVTANQDIHGVQLFLKKPSDTSYYGKKTAHFVGGTGVRSIDLKHYFHKHTSVVGTYKVSVRVLEMGKNMWSKHHYLSENVTITSSQ